MKVPARVQRLHLLADALIHSVIGVPRIARIAGVFSAILLALLRFLVHGLPGLRETGLPFGGLIDVFHFLHHRGAVT
jgi:hypothetical protein